MSIDLQSIVPKISPGSCLYKKQLPLTQNSFTQQKNHGIIFSLSTSLFKTSIHLHRSETCFNHAVLVCSLQVQSQTFFSHCSSIHFQRLLDLGNLHCVPAILTRRPWKNKNDQETHNETINRNNQDNTYLQRVYQLPLDDSLLRSSQPCPHH